MLMTFIDVKDAAMVLAQAMVALGRASVILTTEWSSDRR